MVVVALVSAVPGRRNQNKQILVSLYVSKHVVFVSSFYIYFRLKLQFIGSKNNESVSFCFANGNTDVKTWKEVAVLIGLSNRQTSKHMYKTCLYFMYSSFILLPLTFVLSSCNPRCLNDAPVSPPNLWLLKTKITLKGLVFSTYIWSMINYY